MATKKPTKIKPAQLRDAFKADLARCWQHARSLHPRERPYAFVLHGLEGTPHLYPYVLTEEGLVQVANRYVANGHYDTVDEARKELRYSMEDSPHAAELEGSLPTVDALVEPIEDTLDESEGYAFLAKAAMEAFMALDKQGTFGQGAQREKLLLMIETSLAEKDWSKSSAKRLNSAAAFRRFETETKVEGTYASSNALTFSPNGRSLFFAGGREIDPRKEEKNFSEIVACDVVGFRLKRRWSFSFPRFGDSGQGVTCLRDGTVAVLRTQFVNGKERTMLMRFGRDSNKPLQNATFAGSASDFALSDDGLRIALSMRNKTVLFLDQTLGTPQVIKLKSMPYCIKTLKSGDMLVGTDAGIFQVDKKFATTLTSYTSQAFTISIDAAEKLMAVSRFFCISGSEKEKNAEFGFQILSLPEMKVLRSVSIPNHQLVTATLSPNGMLVAFEAHEVGKPQQFIVVYDTATFREIARRRSGHLVDMVFSPDSKTLAFTQSGYTKFEPIVLWGIPGV